MTKSQMIRELKKRLRELNKNNRAIARLYRTWWEVLFDYLNDVDRDDYYIITRKKRYEIEVIRETLFDDEPEVIKEYYREKYDEIIYYNREARDKRLLEDGKLLKNSQSSEDNKS